MLRADIGQAILNAMLSSDSALDDTTIAPNYGTDIKNKPEERKNHTYVRFGAEPYIGLFRAKTDEAGNVLNDDYNVPMNGMPKYDGSGGWEPNDEVWGEDAAKTYFRVKLRKEGLREMNIIGPATIIKKDIDGNIISDDDEDTAIASQCAVIRNQEMIVFPEAEEDLTTPSQGGWGRVSGFGIYESKTAEKPIFWARIVDPETKEPTTVPIEKNDVPIIRIDQFEITLV